MNHTHLTVLITGGATGIGLALAKKFYSAGNRVILVGRSKATLAEAVNLLPNVETCVADISLIQDRERLVAQFPDVSILINNAGIQINAPILESTTQDIAHELDVNFLSPVLLTHAFLPTLIPQATAAIVNISSGLALVPKQSAAMYCASKAALHSFSKTLRWQLEDTNVRVFEVLPPLVETAMTEGRGKGKISPTQFADAFLVGFSSDRYEMFIGKTKLLNVINRFSPSVAEKIMRHAL